MVIRLKTFFVAVMFAVASVNCGGSSPEEEPNSADPEVGGDPAAENKGDAEEAQGPKPVENDPGNLQISKPARGAFIEASDSPIQVIGSGATSALTINGTPAKVAADGTFEATIQAKPGMNLILAVDGESRLETPFLYGHFVSATTPVDQAVALGMNREGLNAKAPDASLTGIVNEALKGRNLLSALRGKTFSGKSGPANWSYTVKETNYKNIAVKLGPRQGGLDVAATLDDAKVDGRMTIKMPLGISVSRDVTITASRATVSGAANLSVEKGALTAAMPSANTGLEGFRFDSNNAGLPCCVDDIATKFLRPRIEDALRDGVRDNIPKSLAVTLDSIGLPKNLEFAGLRRPIPIKTRFDGGAFESSGMMLSASALFGGAFEKDEPGAAAPGWLQLGKPIKLKPASTPVATSVSVDALNQLLFAVWGQGNLARSFDVAPVGAVKLDAKLPPLFEVTSEGAVRAVVSEVVVEGGLGETKLKGAVTLTQDVLPKIEGQTLLFESKGPPNVTLTWLHDGARSADLALKISTAGTSMLNNALRSLKVPLPRAPLDAAGPALVGKSLGLSEGEIKIDPAAARVAVQGAMTLAGK